MTQSVASFVYEELYDQGIRDIFCVTGGAIAAFTEVANRAQKMRLHYFLNEQAAGIAAEAYGFSGGTPAVLVVTSGPGVTNALTPVAAAYTNSSPMVVISGQARSQDLILATDHPNRQWGNQHLNTLNIVTTIVKQCIELSTPEIPLNIVKEVVGLSLEGRQGPVWISIASDVQRMEVRPFTHRSSKLLKSPAEYSFDHILEELQQSKRPLLLLGNGARSAIDDILKFVEKLSIPVVTTWPGLDLISFDHELYVGRPGTIASSWAPNMALSECDLLIIIGARLDLPQIGFRPDDFAQRAKVFRIDVDEHEFLRIPNRTNWLNIKAESIAFGRYLNSTSYLKNESEDFHNWRNQISTWKSGLPDCFNINQNLDDGISTYLVSKIAASKFSDHTIVTGSSGTCIEMILQSWMTTEGQRVINSCGLGSMGFAVYSAIGVYLRNPEKDILCIESDGSFFMNPLGIPEAALRKIPLKLIILDSGGYKSIHLSQQRLGHNFHGESRVTGLYHPPLVDLIESFKVPVKLIERSDDLENAIDWLRHQSEMSVVIVAVSEAEEALPRLISKIGESGKMETPPYSELTPKDRFFTVARHK
jgi:acetolactate synthase I/II/III large subunit